MRLLVLILLAGLAAIPCCAENLIVNGDFETGDLTGWIDASPETVPQFATKGAFRAKMGYFPPPTQVFSADAPMYIGEMYSDANGVRRMRNIGLAEEVKPRGKYAVGWTRTGEGKVNYPWISQILHVAPGRYLMNASWDVAVRGGGTKPHLESMAGLIGIFVDGQIHRWVRSDSRLRPMVWHNDSKGGWITHTPFEGYPIETSTGRIEVRLLCFHGNERDIAPPDFEFVAIDNIYFSLTPDVLRERGK